MSVARYGALGASLYVPATHPALERILAKGCHGARSIILCTEDAISDADTVWAVPRLLKMLAAAPTEAPCLRFVRPRSPKVLRQLIADDNALNRLAGIVIPKFDHDSADAWQQVLALAPSLPIMPTLETPAMFQERTALLTRDALRRLSNPVITLRIGANDLLGTLGLKRQPGQTLYETPLRSTLERLITLFRPAGFELAAPVCDLLDEPHTLAREVDHDIDWGFFAKTCVHPAQISIIEDRFAAALETQYPQAHTLLHETKTVFKDGGQMLEKPCHHRWAERITTLRHDALAPSTQAGECV